MKALTEKEERIVKFAIFMHKINEDRGFIPDYNLVVLDDGLTMDQMRDIRDIVQSLPKGR